MRSHITLRVAALIALASTPSAAFASPTGVELDTSSSKIGFTAHTNLFDVPGVFQRASVSGTIDPDRFRDSSLTLTIDACSVDTDNGWRDDHLKNEDFFWCAKHPDITFVTKSVVQRKGGELVVVGDLTVRGVEAQVAVPITVQKGSDARGAFTRVRAKLEIDRTRHGITYTSSFPQPSIRNTVDLKLDLRLRHTS